MRKVCLVLVLALCLVARACASSEPWSAAARASLAGQLSAWRVSEAGGWGSPEATRDAIDAYTQLDAPAVPQGSKLCPGLQAALTKGVTDSDFDDIHNAAAALAALRCSNVNVPSGAKAAVQAGLNDRDVEDIYHATQAALALNQIKGAPQLKDFDFSKVGSNLLELLEEDGTFRSTPEDEEGSAYHAGLALEALGELSQAVPNSVDKAVLRQVADKVQALVKTGINNESKKVDFTHGAPADVSPLEAVGAVIDGIRALSAVVSEPLDVKKPQIIALGDYLLRHASVSDVEDADALSSSLAFLADNPIFIPYYVRVTEAHKGSFTLDITNVLEAATTKLNVLVESAKMAGVKGPGLQGLVFAPVSEEAANTKYVLNEKSAAQLKAAAPGFYDFKLNLVPKSQSTPASGKVDKYKPQAGVDVRAKLLWRTTRGERVDLAIVTGANKPNAKDVKEGEVVRNDMRFPDQVEGVTDVFDASKTLHVTVRLEDRDEHEPQAMFLHFLHASSEQEVMFMLKPTSENAHHYSIKLSFGSSELIEALQGAGTYAVSVVMVDPALDKMTTWNLITVTLNIPASSKPSFDAALSPKPLLSHLFRAPESRPPIIVSLVFTLLVVAPFGGLLVALSRSGISWALPSNPSEFLYAVVFQGAIAAILASYTLYWLGLNIFQAFVLLAACSTVAAFAGTGALRMLHQRSRAEKGKTE